MKSNHDLQVYEAVKHAYRSIVDNYVSPYEAFSRLREDIEQLGSHPDLILYDLTEEFE